MPLSVNTEIKCSARTFCAGNCRRCDAGAVSLRVGPIDEASRFEALQVGKSSPRKAKRDVVEQDETFKSLLCDE